jgi:hypothetical protein
MIKSGTIWFGIHLTLTIGAYFIPFMFDWPLVITAYSIVILQFAFFGRCLMNEGHDLPEDDGQTFYSNVLERLGYRVNRKVLRRFVRGYLYFILILITLIWQVYLGREPWLPILS